MKRRAKRRHASNNHLERRPAISLDRRIILLDDAPWRERAAAECQRELAKLDQARAEWQRFEQKDQPAFARWTAVTFGPLLTELRDNARRIVEQEALIEEVEMEMFWSDQRNPRQAYATVKKRRENPDPADDFTNQEDGMPSEDEDGLDGEIPVNEQAAIFEEFVRAIGADPDRLPKAEYAKMFADFQTTVLGEDPESAPPTNRDQKKPAAPSMEARLKETYRILVRRLHPDLRAGADAAVSAIWHEVQEAYQAGNLERLETLLALTQMQDGTNGGQASLSQMRGALEELRRSLHSLQRSIKSAKREPAWAFSQTEDHAPLAKRLRRELEASLSEQRKVLADLRWTINDWSRPAQPAPKRPGKPGAKAKTEQSRRGPNVLRPAQPDLFPF